MKYQRERIENVGDFIKELRESENVSRNALSIRSGISLNMLFHLEKHITKSPSVRTFEKILDTLGYEIIVVKKMRK